MQQDIAAKALEEYNEVYAEIFNEIVFDGKQILDEKELKPLPTSARIEQTDGVLHEYFRDIRKVDRNGQKYILVTALENQAGKDRSMPVRVMGYEFSSYAEQIRQLADRNQKKTGTRRLRADQRIAPAVSAVLYWGKGSWEQPSRLYDLLDFSEESQRKIQPFVNDYRIHVISMRRLPGPVRERLHGDLRGVVECISEEQADEETYRRLQADDVEIRHPEEFFALMGALLHGEKYAELKDRWIKEGCQEGMKMSSLLDMAEEIGMKRGIGEGRTLERKNLVTRMISRGFSEQEIMALADVTEKEIQEYKHQD